MVQIGERVRVEMPRWLSEAYNLGAQAYEARVVQSTGVVYELLLEDLGRNVILPSAEVQIERIRTEPGPEGIPYFSLRTPWQHQRVAYERSYPHHAYALFMYMRTGKTKVITDLVMNRQHQRTLVLCPSSAIRVWEEEVPKDAGEHVRVVPLRGTLQEREERLAERYEDPVLFVTNYEAVHDESVYLSMAQAGLDFLVLDESHHIKKPGGVRSRRLLHVGKRVPYRMILTGTPMPNSPLDIYAQYRFLDSSIFGTRYDDFRSRYAIMGGYQGRMVVGYQNLDELEDKMHSIAYRVDSSVLDLPEAIDMYRYFDIGKRASGIYADIREQAITRLAETGSEIRADNVLVEFTRMQQIVCGFVVDEEGNTVALHKGREQALREVLDEIDRDEPLVVLCRFSYDIARVHQVVHESGRTSREISGQVDHSAEWERGDADVLVGQIQACREALDLSRSHYIIYYSMNFSYGDYDQTRARIQGSNQRADSVAYIHLVGRRESGGNDGENTIDDLMLAAIRRKETISRMLVDRPDELLGLI